jgi:hypothetical protein
LASHARPFARTNRRERASLDRKLSALDPKQNFTPGKYGSRPARDRFRALWHHRKKTKRIPEDAP